MRPDAARLLRREDGATATEYAIMAVLIAAVIIGVVALLGEELARLFSDVVDALGAMIG